MLAGHPRPLVRAAPSGLPFFFVLMPQKITHLKVCRLRVQVQKNLNMNINQARYWCASAAHVEPKNWLAWETNLAEMPSSVYQLVQVKIILFDADLLRVNVDMPGTRHTISKLLYYKPPDQKWNRPTIKDQAKNPTKKKPP